MEQITVAGINILVERKKMKNMYLRVHASDETVKMTVTQGTSAEVIRRSALSKIDWIRKVQEKLAAKNKKTVEWVNIHVYASEIALK